MKNMKNWIRILVVALLCTLVAPAAFAENQVRLAANIDAVKTVLDDNDLVYIQMGDNEDVFYLSYDLDCTLNSCDMWIIVYDDGVHFQADCEASAPENTRSAIASYMIRQNKDMRVTSLYMDDETGLLGCQYFLYSDAQIPTASAIGTCLTTVLGTLEDHGNNLAALMYSTKVSRLF